MTDLSKTTRLAALMGCAAIAGCGGGSQQQDFNTTAPQQAPQLPVVTTPEGATASGGVAEASVHGAATSAVPKPRSFPVAPLVRVENRALRRLHAFQAAKQQARALSAAEHSRAVIGAVRDLTDAVLLSEGLEFATYDVLDGGRTVTINVLAGDACSLQPSDPATIENKILDASDTVDHVHLRLTTGAALGPYLKRHCSAKASQAGLGPVLLTSARDGIFETKPFIVTRSRWTIDWSSASNVLQVYVYKGGKLQSAAVNHQGRGKGRVTLTGTGTYTLRVAGTAGWRLQVRNGAPPRPPVIHPTSQPTSTP